MAELHSDLAKLKSSVQQMKRTKQMLEEDKQDQLAAFAKLELDVQELEGQVSDGKQSEKQVVNELVQVSCWLSPITSCRT